LTQKSIEALSHGSLMAYGSATIDRSLFTFENS